MYCRLCDIEYPKSLRFCKWCGGGLVSRESVANQHCPSCGSEIEKEWVFCNECGIDLATLGAQPRDVPCPACSATVRKGWMFCRQCGEQVATERAAERCETCNAGVRTTWTFCKQCGTRLKADAAGPSHGFRTVSGIPALPPEDLEEAPFSNLRSGELPPLEDVMRTERRRAVGPTPPPPPAADGAHAGGTHPLTSSRSTGQLDADSLEREIRSQPHGEPAPPTPAPFGRLEASELLQASPPAPSEPDATRAYSPAANGPAAWGATGESAVVAATPAAEPHPDVVVPPQAPPAPPVAPGYTAPPPQAAVPDTTQAFASPFAPQPPAPQPTPPPAPTPQPPPLPPPAAYVTEIQQRVATAPPMPAPPQQPSYPPPAPPPQPAPPAPGWPQPGYGQTGQQQPQPSYGQGTMPIAPPTADYAAQPAFPPPTRAPAPAASSPIKWIAIALVVVAVLAVGSVGGIFAWRAWKAHQTQVIETPQPAPPQPAPPAPAPQPEAPTTPTPPDGMVYVAGATFSLGTDDPSADEYSRPAHEVTVKPYFLDRTEVTNAQYKAFVDETGHTPPKEGWVNGAPKPGTEQWPVIYVTWDDASAYAKWAGKRLPTESEWELAARGTDGRLYPWGNEWDPTKGNLGKDGKTGTPEPVGSHEAGKSPCGALDLLGNVWEWTSSPFVIYPGGKAKPPEGDNFKIIRGGAFDNTGKNTAVYRGFFQADSAWPKVGFRCAKDAP